MAKVIHNFSDDVLELIGTGEEFHEFEMVGKIHYAHRIISYII